MERIVLEVDDTVGKVYRQFSEEGKLKFKEAVSIMLKKAINNNFGDLYKIEMDQIGYAAVSNGLTQKELEKLLADDQHLCI